MAIKERVLNDLQGGKEVSSYQAMMEYGTHRLAAYIHRLRQEGHKIESVEKTGWNSRPYASYRLVQG